MGEGRYDGEVAIYPAKGERFRVWIQAANVTAEVYISRVKAQELHEQLGVNLRKRELLPATENQSHSKENVDV